MFTDAHVNDFHAMIRKKIVSVKKVYLGHFVLWVLDFINPNF